MAAPVPVDQRLRHVACNKRPCGAAARGGSEKKWSGQIFCVVFGTALVQHHQHVMPEPRSDASAAMVRELLAPFGLSLGETSPSVFAVIRSAKSSAESLPATTTTLPITLSELTVTANHYRLVGLSGTPLAIEGPQLRAEPHFADDALQSVGRLPGVAQNGFAGLMHIRGGESGETRVLLDGFPIREVFHLPDFQGPFRALDASAIKRIDVYTRWLSGPLQGSVEWSVGHSNSGCDGITAKRSGHQYGQYDG